MEEFDVSLGVDPSVKITYKPIKKFQQRTGVISKSDTTNFHQVIEIKNTKSQPVKIIVTDQCPQSSSDKIKVNSLAISFKLFRVYKHLILYPTDKIKVKF